MQKMRKSFLSLLFVICLLGGSIVPTYAAQVLQSQNNDKHEIHLNAVISKEKTVVKFYADRDDIKDSINYSEYADGMTWSGFLNLDSTQKTNGGWYATYKGTLCSHT